MHQETHARITTQLALRDTVKSYENFRATASQRVTSIMNGKKHSRKNMVMLFDKMLDEAFTGNLISKLVVKDSARKTSKHMAHQWIYLHYDAKRPYTRREEHLIEVYGTEMITNKPDAFSDYKLGIFVTRHLLERAALRMKATCIEDMVDFLNSYILMMTNKKMREACYDGNGLILVTKNEYVVVDATDEKSIILKTVLPRKEWSKEKAKKLLLVIKELEREKCLDDWNAIAVMSADDFNNLSEIRPENVNIFHPSKDPK